MQGRRIEGRGGRLGVHGHVVALPVLDPTGLVDVVGADLTRGERVIVERDLVNAPGKLETVRAAADVE